MGQRRVLLIVENESVPHDRRVYLEARTLHEAGWQVCVICPRKRRGVPWREDLEGIEVRRFPLWEAQSGAVSYLVEYGFALFFITVLALWFRLRGRIDVVHLANPPDVLFPVAAPLRWVGAAVIFDHHDLAPELWLSKGGKEGGILHRLLRVAERRSMGTADVVISTNESYKEIAMDRGGVGPEDVFIVRNGPAVGFVPVDPETAPPPRYPYLIGYIGTMGPQDGVDHLIRALSHIVNERGRSDVGAVLIGGGSEAPSLVTLAGELGVSERVTFAGVVPHADIPRLLAHVQVCVSPDPASPFNDRSTMIKTMEYLALEKPVVAYDLTETRVTAGECGLYANADNWKELGELVLELLDDPDRASALGRAGRERMARDFGWDRSAPRLLAAYDRALAVRSGSTTSTVKQLIP